MKKQIALEFLIFSFEALSVLFLFQVPILLGIILICESIIYLSILKQKKYILLYMIAMIVGPCAEAAAIFRNAWTYQYITFLNLPFWLPFAWGIVVLCIYRLYILISDFYMIEKNKNRNRNAQNKQIKKNEEEQQSYINNS